MAWIKFPYPDAAYTYSAASLKKNWPRLHGGDAEPLPQDPALQAAWIAFHAGQFEQAVKSGLALGTAGYAVANKAACIYATYLEKSETKNWGYTRKLRPEKEKRIPCKRPATETFAKLAEILPCDEENALASCQPSQGGAKE